MIIHVLFGLRKESYQGQYAPEALEVVDEFSIEENPDWLHKKQEELEKTKEFSTLEIVNIEITTKLIEDVLYKKYNNVKGKIK